MEETSFKRKKIGEELCIGLRYKNILFNDANAD